MTVRRVYSFGDDKADGDWTMKDVLGGKGAGLAEMTNLGIPVPPGFTITTGACLEYVKAGKMPDGLKAEVAAALALLEARMKAKLGDVESPLLVSVRSGAKVSMPGMMDTILNLGLNDKSVAGHAARADERFAWDCYRRFVQMHADVVLDVDKARFEHLIAERKKERGVSEDTKLLADDWKALVDQYKAVVREVTGAEFPQDPQVQLWGAIEAVFKSWGNPRAVSYRRMNKIPDDLGTAVNIQAMVFGNMGDDCATGVAFTRNPATGERRFYGEWLPNAQGEDVVAGTRTPRPMAKEQAGDDSLEQAMPAAYARLIGIQNLLESHYRDMQDIEFTIQHGELFMLQTRTGKRTGPAAVRIAVEMVDEGIISSKEAVQRVEANSLEQLLKPVFTKAALARAREEKRWLANGLNAGPGAATGRIAFSAEHAVSMAKKGPVVLVRVETSPEDIDGMESAQGILTARGGATSHAALVARQMGKPCVAGCGALEIHYDRGEMSVAGRVLKEGDDISIDGTTGDVYAGSVETEPSEITRVLVDKSLPAAESAMYGLYARLMGWADEFRKLRVRANADSPHDAEVALSQGAEGIGLCRTEHMFFDEARIRAFREMIAAPDEKNRREALAAILPFQREDFAGIFRVMGARPVTIRLLDPPLHEFLPHEPKQQAMLAQDLGISLEQVQVLVERLAEANPMLGHRGCRLGISYPEIYELQVQAIVEAACEVAAEGVDVHPEIMIPLVGEVGEFTFLKTRVDRVAAQVMKAKGRTVKYLVGTMIEVPRAALTSGAIASAAEFFSYGTNDLTQMAMGISRDDAARFLGDYFETRILKVDPFQSIDVPGVGRLVEISVKEGRAARPSLKIGVCGEHGGDADSVKFFHGAGLDYVSCSPYRLPTARLAAAQAALAAAASDAAAAAKAPPPPSRGR